MIYSDYTYADIDSYNVALYDYNGDNTVLTIPESFSGRYVSEIYAYAFENNNYISYVDFSQNGNRLNTIATKAFNECTGLSGALNLPSSVRTLGFAAFQGCVNLESVTINYGISEIPAQCFNRCSAIKTVTLAPSVESIGNLAFAKCMSLEKVYLPTSVTYISTSAFNGNYPTLYVYNGSYSHEFAINNNFNYVIIDPPQSATEHEPTESSTEAPTEIEPSESPTEATPTENPMIHSTEVPTEVLVRYLGDVDGDGEVASVDTTIIQRYLCQISIYTENLMLNLGDVDGDMNITIIDVSYIQRYITKIETPYPIGKQI